MRQLVADGLDGDVLVFLPGAARSARRRRRARGRGGDVELDVVPLHGDLTPDEQDRAVAPAPRRKVILSTNVAETSVTIEGVVAVIDSGWRAIARHSPWSGVPTLKVAPVSRASATQRAGRAGRTRPGACVRLYTQHDHDTRPALELPEIARADLAEPRSRCAAPGVARRRAALVRGAARPRRSRRRDGAARRGSARIDERDAITALGRRMLRFPLHPRLGAAGRRGRGARRRARGVRGRGAARRARAALCARPRRGAMSTASPI